LTALLDQSHPHDRYEVVVVDDASADATPAVLERWQEAHPGRLRCLHQERNRGPAAARNRGVAKARGQLIAFTDDDCVVIPDWLKQIQRGLEEPGIVGVGGQVLPLGTDSTVERYQARHSAIARPAMRQGEVTSIVTANAVFKRDVLLEVGGFPERLTFAGGEETELCGRIRESGHRLGFNPEAVVYHRYDASWRAFLRTFFRYGQGTAFHQMRHREPGFGLLLRWHVGMLVWPYRLWRHCQWGERGKDLVSFTLLDSLRGLGFLLGVGCGYYVYSKEGRGG
jgi:GT2 family glycosyltransferase